MTTTIQVPFDIGPSGRVGVAEGEYAVTNQHIKTILMTRITERIMYPTYGSRVLEFLFEQLDEISMQELDDDIREAIRRWEPSVDILEIFMDDRGSRLDVDVQYTLAGTLGAAPKTVSVSIARGGTVEETP